MRQGIVTEFRHIHATHRHPHPDATPCDNAALRHCASRRWRDGSSRND